jgi:RNA polymerase sigma-70 factor (ECF subfamily)
MSLPLAVTPNGGVSVQVVARQRRLVLIFSPEQKVELARRLGEWPISSGAAQCGQEARQTDTADIDGGRPQVSAGDRRLVRRASRGDVEAFTKLVQEHSPLVHRVALRVLEGENSQDASQEVWIRVWRNIKSFRGESAFSTWLYRIAVNTCLNIRQREARREEREVGGETSYLSEPTGGEADPEAGTLSAERRDEIQAALKYVRAEHRAALVLRHMEGLSYAEIAEVLEIPDGTAKGWVSRGRAAMLMALTQERTSGSMG